MADSTSETIFTTDKFTGPTERTFTTGMPTETGATYQEFVGQQTEAGTFEDIKRDLSANVASRFLELGLQGDVKDVNGRAINLDSYFGNNLSVFRKDMKGLYPAAQEAFKREKDGTATPDDVALLGRVRDPQGTVMSTINSLSTGHPVLSKGYIETGTFPRNSLTGEIEGLEVIPESVFDEGGLGPFGVDTPRDIATRRAEDGERLLRFARNHPDLQSNEVIQRAVVQAIEGDILDVTAERLYNLASATEEGVRHYLPRFGRWAAASVLSTISFGLTDELIPQMTEEDVAQDLASVRNSSFFANRQEVLNDMIRDQLVEMGYEDAMREAGYLEKQEVDGVERYTKNFVSSDFAEGFFEQVFDNQTFIEKMASLALENVGAYAGIKAPIQGTANAQRMIRRQIDNVRGRPSGFKTRDGFEVPQKFSIASPQEQLAVSAEYAALRGIPLQEAGRQLAMMNKSANFWNKWTAGRIVDRLGVEANRQAVAAAGMESVKRISLLQTKSRNAALRGQKSDVLKFQEQIRMERAYQNWRMVKAAAPMAKSYGISPKFDIFMAGTQVAMREVMGPIGEAVGAGALIAGMGTLQLFDMKFPKALPIVGGPAKRLAFSAKVGVEDAFAFFLEFNSIAARGYAQGILVNPGLRGLMGAAPEELSKIMSAGQMRQLEDFSKRMFTGMNPMMRETMLDSMETGFQDVEKIVASFEPYLDIDMLRGLRQTLSLNLGQSTGMGVYLSLANSVGENAAGLKATDIEKFSTKMKKNLDFQYEAEQQQGAMTAAVEMLDSVILKIENNMMSSRNLLSADDIRARETALDNLKVLAGSFKNAEQFGRASLEKMLRSDLEAADRVLTELTLESNEKFLEEAFLSGQIDDMLAVYSRMDSRVQAGADIAPEGAVAPAMETGRMTLKETTPAQLRQAGTNLETALKELRTAVKATVDRGRVSQNAEEMARKENTTVLSVLKMSEAASVAQVDAAYANIPSDVIIPLDTFALGMRALFSSYAVEGQSFIKMIDPVRFNSFAGGAGKDFIYALDKAALRGLSEHIADRLPSINEKLGPMGFSFATPDDFIAHMRGQIASEDKAFMRQAGLKSEDGSDISGAQLVFYAMESPMFASIDAASIGMKADVQELETLRQGANALLRDGSEKQQQLARAMRAEIDKTFDTWGQGANLETYNAVVLARKTHQLERQRFGKGTFGGKVNKAIGETRVAEGVLEVGDAAKISTLLKPITQYITKPTKESAAQLEGVMDDFLATFAPVTSSMAEQVLKKDANGRYVLPTSEDIAATTSRVMDVKAFEELQIVFDVVIRNAFYDQTNMRGLREALEGGQLPALAPESAPRRIKAPAGYTNNDNPLEAYFNDIQEKFVVQVMDSQGNVTTRKLFDMDELIMQDRNIVNVVNAVPEYRQLHGDLVSVAQTQRTAIEGSAKLVEGATEAKLKEISAAPKLASGQGFLNDVIKNPDPLALDNFVSRIADTKRMVALTEDQTKAAYRALFVDTLKAAGGYTRGTRPVTMFDGKKVPADSYKDPQNVFLLLDDALVGSGTIRGSKSTFGVSDEGRKIRQLADLAGIQEEQLETLHAIFRLSTRVESTNLLARRAGGNLTNLTKGFTLDNALSKAFNLARGMVSKEYVAAEVALKYAALTQGKAADFLLTDPRAAGIVKNLLEQDDLVSKTDAEYFSTALMKFIAGDLPATVFQVPDVTSNEYAEEYWISQGMLFTPEPDLFEQAVP